LKQGAALLTALSLIGLANVRCEPDEKHRGAEPPASLSRAAPSEVPRPAVSGPPPVPGYKMPLPVRERGDTAPAKAYANLEGAVCRKELESRKLPVKAARGKTPGLAAPLQLIGPLGGVRFELPKTVYGFLECRLVLLLHELSGELARHGVVAVQVNNTYRPNSKLAAKPSAAPPPAPAPSARKSGKGAKAVKKPAKATKKPAKPAPAEPAQVSQHALGLAIDITEFQLGDGRVLNVERDWHGARGEAPCGPLSRVADDNPEGIALRDITCSIARGGYCNHLITPSRDEAHANHLHCDIEAGANEIMTE